ncbi:hypothetical protein ACLB2K_046974 [Fragaria x ananassa]
MSMNSVKHKNTRARPDDIYFSDACSGLRASEARRFYIDEEEGPDQTPTEPEDELGNRGKQRCHIPPPKRTSRSRVADENESPEPGFALDVDHPLAAVHLDHLALASTWTSSSLRTSMNRTLYLVRRSEESGALIRMLRTDVPPLKRSPDMVEAKMRSPTKDLKRPKEDVKKLILQAGSMS